MSSKPEVVTLKVDADLAEALRRVPNKSEFIRQAVIRALDHLCPLCQGTGQLTPAQQAHWDAFAAHHHVQRCQDCDSVYLACDQDAADPHQLHEHA